MADSENRYVTDVVVYEGKGTSVGDEGMGHEVVTNLCGGLRQHWHTIVYDNLFNSPRLFHDLMVDGLWATGILRTGRVGVPKVISQYRGEVGKRGGLVIKMHAHRQMCAMAWQDSVVVQLLSTKQDARKPNCNVLKRSRDRKLHMVVPSTPFKSLEGNLSKMTQIKAISNKI
jgi:hypothetical protein